MSVKDSQILRECPFCGGEAHTYRTIAQRYCAICNEPFCANVGPFDTKAEAIAAWNSRIERTCENIDNDEDSYFRCSVCNISTLTEFMSGGYGLPNYCPNCGAKVTPKYSEILRSEVGE